MSAVLVARLIHGLVAGSAGRGESGQRNGVNPGFRHWLSIRPVQRSRRARAWHLMAPFGPLPVSPLSSPFRPLTDPSFFPLP